MCNAYRRKGLKIFLYRFPRDNTSVYREWLQISGISEEDEQKFNPKICDKCFEETDFVHSNDERKKLKEESLPKIRKLLGKRHVQEESSVSII